jgi:hypothetical protein
VKKSLTKQIPLQYKGINPQDKPFKKESAMDKKDVTPGLKSAVSAYLMARARAEVLREKIDKIEREILESACYFSNPLLADHSITKRITEPSESYLLKEDDARDYLLDVRAALMESGYDIKQVPNEPEHHYFCPALTAESLQTTTEHLIIENGAEMLGEDPKDFSHRLLCAGLDKYKEFIDLCVKLVVNLPDFKKPLGAV